jgi:uncharacterized protein (TIGR03437 family)
MMIKISLYILLGSGLNAVAQSPGTFVATGSMTTPRAAHTATLLKDGRVLITGGTDLPTAELYDPSSGTFTSTGAMATPRSFHTATLLNEGRVLIAGGFSTWTPLSRNPSAELYDPSTGTFTPTGNMVAGDQSTHSATLLNNGKVLISGGSGSILRGFAAPELYDPGTGAFTPAGDVRLSKQLSTATLLLDGKVLVAGGWNGGGASLFDPTSGRFTILSNALFPIWSHTATLLLNGAVLITGGGNFVVQGPDDGEGIPIGIESTGTAQIFTGSVLTTGSLLEARERHTATLLSGGLVLVAGGNQYYSRYLASAELYDPATSAFTHTGGMKVSRIHHTATLLRDGSVLITGGDRSYYPPWERLASAELYVRPPVMAVSSASQAAPLAPESLASLFGSGLASRTESANPSSPSTTLAGISLRVRDSSGMARLATLLYVSPSQISFEVPAETASGDITLELSNSPAQVPPVAVQVRPVAPGIFTFENNTAGAYAVRIEPKGAQTLLSVRNTIVLDDRPVYLILYATGIRNRSSVAKVHVTIGATSVPVEYAGPEGSGISGLDQVNVRLTPILKGLSVSNLVLDVDGISSNTVSVDIR